MPIIPEVVEQQKLGYNPPHLVMIHDKIIVCSGCEIPFNRKDCKEPNNLVFKYVMFRTRPNGRGQKVVNKFRSAGYFHAQDLGCLRNLEELEQVEFVAAWRDICLMMLQDRDYKAHMSNTGKVSGKGMNLKQKHARWNKAEEDFVDSCIDAMQNRDLEQEAMFNLHPEKFLVPSTYF